MKTNLEKIEIDGRLRSQLEFSLEIDREKQVFRQTRISGGGRRENDAEHAWHMAVMAYILKEYSNRRIDIARTMIMCLIHDIVEIDAGDTYAYDEEGKKTQKEREEKAKDRIFSILPGGQAEEMKALFEEFEKNESAEAQFAHAMDNIQPILLNNSNGGADWQEHGVSAGQVLNRQEKTKPGSLKIFSLAEKIIKMNVENGSLKMQDAAD